MWAQARYSHCKPLTSIRELLLLHPRSVPSPGVPSSDPSLGTMTKAKHGGGGCEAEGDLVSGLVRAVLYLLLVGMGVGVPFWDC